MKVSNIAIITARKGSKRIKNKNLKNFFGKPIIYYSIKTLQKLKFLTKYIYLQIEKTIQVAKKYGIKRFIRRANYLSSNNVGTITIINHALKKLKKRLTKICMLLVSTSFNKIYNIKFSYLQRKIKI